MGAKKLPATGANKNSHHSGPPLQIVMSVTQMSFDIRAPVAQEDNKRDG
jgi:hypothetical protein